MNNHNVMASDKEPPVAAAAAAAGSIAVTVAAVTATDPFIAELGLPVEATLKCTSSNRNSNSNSNVAIASLETTRPGATASIRIPISLETCLRKNSSNGQCLVVGRQASGADLRIQHATISRKHAVFYYHCCPHTNNISNSSNNGQEEQQQQFNLYIKDLSGKHGTTLNHQRMAKGSTMQLNHGDQLVFGNVRESVFTVIIHHHHHHENVVVVQEKESKDDEQQAATAAASQQVMEMAGQGLTGREKRQAEIQAMMASLDQAPVYHLAAAVGGGDDEQQPQNAETAPILATQQQQETRAATILQQQHPLLPIQSSFRVPPDDVSSHNDVDASSSSAMRSRAAAGITCLACDPSGSRFVVGSRDYHLRFYNFAGMDIKKPREYCFHNVIPQDGHVLVDVVYSKTSGGGDRILVGTGSVQPVVLSSEGGNVGAEIIKFVRGDMYVKDQSKTVGHTAAVTGVDWHPLERDIVLTGSMDGSARLWNLNGKTQFQMLCCDKVFQPKTARGQRTAVTSVCFHPSGREFAMGTTCGSIQIWNASSPRASGRPERAIFHAHGGGGGGGNDQQQQQQDYPIHALAYSQDGSRLASRSSVDNCAKVWNPRRLSRSSTPLVTCIGLPAVHERANLAFSPNGKYLCGGATALSADHAESALGISKGGGERQRQRRRELGSLNFYDVSGADDSMDDAASVVVEPLAAIEMNDNNAGPVIVKWHVKLNQILVGCSDGSVIIYYDSKISRNGALIPLAKASRGGSTAGADDLAELIRLRAPKGSAAAVALSKGEIIAPLALPRKPNKRQREEQAAEAQIQKREPERPTSGKHKAGGGTTAAATTTFAQFIADQTVVKTKAIAGKDPREALLQYTEGKSYLGNETKILDTKTVEQEEEEKLQKKR